ncbi:hypothetical protein WISP_81277 [Willisornis vidua]|uniref:Uncharacterized protein n=1 Tax=Willisornis vidua TaxID=1566151 RepID=A0ABQ9D4G1_9PASS|nr:hypothetical protein WISP_81277 [Willisornis vidua]
MEGKPGAQKIPNTTHAFSGEVESHSTQAGWTQHDSNAPSTVLDTAKVEPGPGVRSTKKQEMGQREDRRKGYIQHGSRQEQQETRLETRMPTRLSSHASLPSNQCNT